MNDLLPADLAAWQRLEATFARQAELHGFFEVRTPIVEPTSLFVRSIGEVTDVVQKEMYTFARGDESLTLRPEGTAGCARAYLQHSVHSKEPVTRWYYRGPMFRAERPQRGRYRQFYQTGAEIYGDSGPFCDAELIAFLVRLFEELGIAPLVVKVNSIGGAESRARYRQALLDYLRPLAAELSELSQQRLETNPLRVLDSKNPKDQELVAAAPSTIEALVEADRQHFDGLCAALSAFEVPYQLDTKLVRGLDYYTRTVFEVQTNAGDLGAQNTIAAGGRYDALLSQLGGPPTPAIGFAIGMERILLAMGQTATPPQPFCSLLPLGTPAALVMAKLARELRAAGIRVELDARELSLKSRLRRADSMGARCALVMGDTELERGVVQLKDLAASSQMECPLAEAAARVAQQLTSPAQAAQNPAAPVERDA